VRTGCRVVEIDVARRQVAVERPNGGKTHVESWDYLVIATGAVPMRPNVPGINAEGIFEVKTLEDALRLRQTLENGEVRRAVVVGGGYIGIEMAEALFRWDIEVAIIDMLPQVMGTLDPDMAEPIAEAIRREGISLYLGEKLTGFDTTSNRLDAVVTDKRAIPADVAILGLGVRPNTDLARAAGIALGTKDAIVINSHCRTNLENVWAAGDCVQSHHLVSGKPTWIALGTVANKQGRVAGLNVAGVEATFPGVVGSAITRFVETEIARTGLGERELDDLGIDYVAFKVDGHTLARYYPGTQPITVKLFAEKPTGRLLGGQIVGGQGSAKRIDVIATALHGKLTIEDVVNLDLSYSPPYSPAWDPIHLAARQLQKLL